MIVVDTSIWIEFFRGRNSIVDNHLRKLIDQDQVFLAAPVRLEILMGAAEKKYRRCAEFCLRCRCSSPGTPLGRNSNRGLMARERQASDLELWTY